MGNDLQCLRPSPEKISRLPPNRFKVRNVNESGRIVNKGYLEVTSNDLILHVLNAEPVRWPLRCLRRYGYDANLFSFESGRRCATGPGIYAFKSKYASEIFQLVQETAQHPEENGGAAAGANSAVTTRQRSLSNDAAPPTSSLQQMVSRSSSHASGMNGAVHMNGNLSPHLSLSSNASHPTSPSPLYFNGNGSLGSSSLRMSPISPTIQYVNSSAFGEIPESPLETTPDLSIANGVILEEGSVHERSCDSFGDPALNYARLKLPTDEDKNSGEGEQRNDEKGEDEEVTENGEREDKETAGLTEKREDQTLGEKDGEEEKGVEGIGMGHNRGEESCDKDDVCKDTRQGRDNGEDSDEGPNSEDHRKLELGVDVERKALEEQERDGESSGKEEGKDASQGSYSNLDASQEEDMGASDVTDEVGDAGEAHLCDGGEDIEKRGKDKKGKGDVSDVDRAALLQDVVNGNIHPERLKDRNGDLEAKYNILVNYANLTEQQIQDVLQKLESNRNDNISPCTVCSTSSSSASQRVSPLSYYANLDTAGELPPNWQVNGFQFYPELRTPRSTSSKGSTTSEFTFDVNRGSCSPVDHNYANLDTLPEAQPMRHSLSNGAPNGAANWMILQPPPKGKMNYIQLDFDENDQPVLHNMKPLRRSLSSSASSTPPKTPVSPQQEFAMSIPAAKNDIYARIDIEKTVALANSHRHVEGDTDTSTRRTRHDVWTSNKSR